MPKAKVLKCERTDCFACKNGNCNILTKPIINCTFFKTKEQAEKSKKRVETDYTRWLKRIEKQEKRRTI